MFFVTTSTLKHQSLFSQSSKLDLLEKQLFNMFPDYANALMGYVLMPNHLHLLVGCNQGGSQLSKFMGSFKSLSARLIYTESGSIWEHRFDDLLITTDQQFRIKLNYIHENPVREGLVTRAADWQWSSAGFWLSDVNHHALTKNWDWLSAGDG